VLLIGVAVEGVMLSPGAHITTFDHLKAKHFFTKKAADDLFVNVGETATAATSATNATNATTAANADKLDGLDSLAFKLTCPAGTPLFLGVCIEETSRPATDWGPAVTTCADLGRRLPSIGELWAFRLQPGITLAGSTTTTREMTQDLYSDNAEFGFISVGEDGTIAERQGSTPSSMTNPFRRVAGLPTKSPSARHRGVPFGTP
jgi:hypothetical protein